MIRTLCIASPSYSGSTLLSMLLNAQPDVATIGEVKGGQEDVASYQCSCGTLFVECPFWRRLIAGLAEQGFRYDLSDRTTMPAFQLPKSALANAVIRRPYGSLLSEFVRDAFLSCWPGCRRASRQLVQYNEVIAQLVTQLADAEVFVDSSKDPVRIKYLSSSPFLDLYVVQLVRDGRGVVNSARKNQGMPAAEAARDWQDTHREIERVAKRCCNGRLLPIRYEDLCRRPVHVVNMVREFISLPSCANSIDYRAVEHHVLGNRMRIRASSEIRLDESWREQLSAPDRETFDRIAGPLNITYGYEPLDDPVATPSIDSP